MAKGMSHVANRLKVSSIASDGIMFLSGMLATLILVYSFPIISVPASNPIPQMSSPPLIPPPKQVIKTNDVVNKTNVVNKTTFYDDPSLSYSMEKPMRNWDEKRRQWLAANPSFAKSGRERIMMVTGSQPKPCEDPMGDHLMLRLFKNKVDYCRIHGIDIFYNNVLLHQGMFGYWAKYPLVKAAMISHPEAEWIWWIDSDAVFTDMDFTLPLDEYKDKNFVAYGWPEAISKNNMSMGMNAGVFLIRNCQWSMEFLDRWANHGPQSKEYAKWGEIQRKTFVDKTGESDDQAAICYLIKMENERWGDKIVILSHYYFQGYWLGIVGKFDNISSHYADIDRRVPELRKRHAEKAGDAHRAKWMKYLDSVNTGGYLDDGWRRPFVTHFTGCEPCSGRHNPEYKGDSCRDGMVRALNFGDSQVLRNFGYTRRDLYNTAWVELIES